MAVIADEWYWLVRLDEPRCTISNSSLTLTDNYAKIVAVGRVIITFAVGFASGAIAQL